MPQFAPVVGFPLALGPALALVLAPNASPMTHSGTNTYLLGHRRLAIIDPGPDDPAHLQALLRAIADRPVSHILLTHSHLDHSPLARPLAAMTGAAVMGFGDSQAGRSTVMQGLAAKGLAGGGEGIDHGFAPDIHLAHGAEIPLEDRVLRAIHTPGHMGNHLCFQWGDIIFTGDHVMGWASSLVSPPDGDLTDFMASCARLARYGARIFYPGHGAPITDPAARLAWLVSHRKSREAQIIAALDSGTHDVSSLTKMIYAQTPAALWRAAERNVFAHLVDLHGRGLVIAENDLHHRASFRKSGRH